MLGPTTASADDALVGVLVYGDARVGVLDCADDVVSAEVEEDEASSFRLPDGPADEAAAAALVCLDGPILAV